MKAAVNAERIPFEMSVYAELAASLSLRGVNAPQ